MFKSARWRSEKNRIKVVFKLQFHATQVPQVVGNSLMVYVTPADMGKPTLRSEKATIREEICYWENPIFEKTYLVQDPKTGKINEKLYHFQLSHGSLKTGFLGEVSIDFADYIDAIKPSSVSLPLKNSKSDAVLHVSIQRMQENADQREVKESEISKVKLEEKSLKTSLSNGDTSSIEDVPCSKATSNVSKLNGNHRVGSIGSDIMSISDTSSSGFDTPGQLSLKTNNGNQEPKTHPVLIISQEHQRSQSDWSVSSDHGLSTDDSTNDSQDIEITKLKSNLLALARQVEVSDLELQTLRKQIVKESKRGQDLFKEVVSLKEERDRLEEKCDKLIKVSKKNKLMFEDADPQALVIELREELNHEKELNSILRVQLQKTQESNSELLIVIQDLDEMLEKKNTDLSSSPRISISKCQTDDDDDDEEQKELEELVKVHNDSKDEKFLEQKIKDLCNEILICGREKDEIEMQMEQLALDYEILKQENHDMSYKLEQSELQDQLNMQYESSGSDDPTNDLETHVKTLEKELSESLSTIDDLKTHIKILEEDLEKQARGFEADLEDLTKSKVEQEQRAIKAEEALRTTRWKNVNTAERIQEEFKRLSLQMTSTFDANEKVAINAMNEANALRLQKNHLEEILKKSEENFQLLKEGYETKIYEYEYQLNLKNLETADKSDQVEIQNTKIEKLTRENTILLKHEEEREKLRIELEQMKASINEKEMLLQKMKFSKYEMEEIIASLSKKTDDLVQELNIMTRVKDKNEKTIETLKSHIDSFKKSLSENELEKEKLQKQFFQLQNELKKKEDGVGPMSNGTKTRPQNHKNASENHGSSKEVANLKERIKLLEGQIKLKETALETLTKLSLDKEKDLQNKIKEVESRLEELNPSSTIFCEHEIHKAGQVTERSTFNGSKSEKTIENTENFDENSATKRCEEISRKEVTAKSDETLSEIAFLKQRNLSMESELKEMQERYSGISLKFAEVEGERQQLVMTVRNLVNSKKN